MIWTVLATAGGFLKRLPWQFWLVLAVLLTGWLWGNYRYGQGVDDERAVWERRIVQAEKQAREADVKAANKRAEDNERNNDADEARKQAAIAGGRHAVNCQRLRAAYPDRSFPACD